MVFLIPGAGGRKELTLPGSVPGMQEIYMYSVIHVRGIILNI